MFTEKYWAAIELAKAHHVSSKTYSGKLMRPHAPFIKDLIDKHGCKTLLDYGCGKGSQYTWVSHGGEASIPGGMTIVDYWNVDITLFDPAYEPFAEIPKGKFDIVIVTHALGSIPITDLKAAIVQIYGYANKAVYIAEKIGEVNKSVFNNLNGMPRFDRAQWEKVLREVPHEGLEVVLSTRLKTENGVETIRRTL